MKNKLKHIISLLKEDYIRNSGILSFIEQNTITEAEYNGKAVLLRGISDRKWVLISCNSTEELAGIMPLVRDEDEFFFSVDQWMVEPLTRGYEVAWKLETGRYYLPPGADIAEPPSGFEQLPPKCAEFIHSNSVYKEFASTGYIKDRLEKGISAAFIKEGLPVAWAITHDDGAIGFLHVVPDERGKGYAKAVTLAMIHLLRNRNELPVVQIEDKNSNALGVIRKLGFIKDRDIIWFHRKKQNEDI